MISPLCSSTKPFHSPGKRDLYHYTSSSHKDLRGKTPGKHGLRRYKIASNTNHNIRQRGATRQAVDDTIRQPWDAEPQLNEGTEAVFITKYLTMCAKIAPQSVGRERTAAQRTMRHRRGECRTVQRQVNALTGKGIKETGGIPYEYNAILLRACRALSHRSCREQISDTDRLRKALPQFRMCLHGLRKKGLRGFLGCCQTRRTHNHTHVDQRIAHWC